MNKRKNGNTSDETLLGEMVVRTFANDVLHVAGQAGRPGEKRDFAAEERAFRRLQRLVEGLLWLAERNPGVMKALEKWGKPRLDDDDLL